MQLELPMADLPRPMTRVWATLREPHGDDVLDVLARVIAKAAHARLAQEDVTHERHDDRS